MSKVAIITDSTACLPDHWIQQYQIRVLPLTIIWENNSCRDGVDLQPAEFYKRLAVSTSLPTTSQVSIAAMQEAFESCLAQGYDVLGIFLSSKFSGTFESAMQAREQLPAAKDKIAVVDSLLTIMAMGWPVLTAARSAQAGESLMACERVALNAIDKSGVLFVVDTLEYLRRGGRIGGAQALLGTVLNIKPVLEMRDGQIESVEKIRTKIRALERVIEIVKERIAGQTPVRLATAHAEAEAEATALLASAAAVLHPVESFCGPLSPVVGAHAGPGTVALTYMAGVEQVKASPLGMRRH